MRVNRDRLLHQLESVFPGLSMREAVEQSSCFVFKDDRVCTFNDEVSCTHDSDLKIEGAVQAMPLLNLLRKMKDEDVEIAIDGNELYVKGKRPEAWIPMEHDILLPYQIVDPPKKWKRLPDDFIDAVTIVQECASRDESLFAMTCVHLHPEWIEACDIFQATRYKIKIGIDKSLYIRSQSLKHITNFDFNQFSQTENWLHFRNGTGLVLSVRRYLEDDYPDISKLYKVKGVVTAFPKGLADAAKRAEDFSSSNIDDNQIRIELRPGKMRLLAEGPAGRYKEPKSIKYNGEPMKFNISPKLLVEITKRYHQCEIAPERLKVDGGKFRYVTCLGKVKEKE